MNPKVVAVSAAVAIAVLAAVLTFADKGAGRPATSSIHPCAPPTRSDHYVGLSVPGFPPDSGNLTSLEKKFQVQPSAVSMYIPLGMTLNMSAVTTVCAQGALPVVEIDSDRIAFKKVTAGAYDSVLTSYAKKLKTLDYPVAIDFDHEFNLSISLWGANYHGAKDFVNAWRHMVNLFRKVGANNVIWIWNPAVNGKGTAPIRPWYPGSAYVTWIGLDGYFTTPQSTFQTVFGPTLADLRVFTKKPVFIDETGANPASQRVRAINSLFSGVERTPGIKGLVWFDYGKAPGHDWQIEENPAALAAFRAGAASYSKG